MMKLGEERKNTRFFILPKKLKTRGTNRKEWRFGRQKVLERCTTQIIPDLHPMLWPHVCIALEWIEEK